MPTKKSKPKRKNHDKLIARLAHTPVPRPPVPVPRPPLWYRAWLVIDWLIGLPWHVIKWCLRQIGHAIFFFLPDMFRPFTKKRYLLTRGRPRKPETLRYWGVLYYGEGSSGKTLHQAYEVQKIFTYWRWLYKKFPYLHRGIVMTNQVMTPAAIKGNEEFYYHFDDGDEMRFCPRKKCWRGEKKHMLHGAVVVLDDVSTFLPPDGWQSTPLWMRKQWSQCGHLGLHFLFNCQDPMAYDINARRQTRLAFGFQKLVGNDRPDETARQIKKVWGLYTRRKIKAKWLWQFGDLEAEQIGEIKEGLKAQAELRGRKKTPFRGIWRRSNHLITRYKTSLYDTLQDVKEYEPAGYIGVKEYDCIDDTHDHDDPEAPNFTKFKKNEHELV